MGGYERLDAIVENASGRAPLLLTCEHATNFIPSRLNGLGLPQELLEDHVGWDIGALAVAKRMAHFLDAPLVAAPASRLLVDANRDFDAHDLIPLTAEGVPIPGNMNLAPEDQDARVAAFHAPFHAAIERVLTERPGIAALVAIHSFTPELFGKRRPWHVGILHGADTRLADRMIDFLSADNAIVVGRNQPYEPAQGVFYSMDRHAAGRATVMIEVRNDLIRDEVGQERWSQRLAGAVEAALKGLDTRARGLG